MIMNDKYAKEIAKELKLIRRALEKDIKEQNESVIREFNISE